MKTRLLKSTGEPAVAGFRLNCKVNGAAVNREINPGMTLLEFLRKELKLTGTKEGCGEGECGACVVLVEEKAVNSCLFMAVQAHGKEIITIEGLKKDGKLHPVQNGFIEEGGVQCGFCTPGMIMSAAALLKKKPDASREEITAALSGNICRCTGYDKIFKAVEASVTSGKEGVKSEYRISKSEIKANPKSEVRNSK